MLNITEDFDPEEVVPIKMATIREVLEKLDAIYEIPVRLGNIVMPNPQGVTASVSNQIADAMLTLFRALPETHREGELTRYIGNR